MSRSIDFRVPLLVGAAVLLLAFSQAKAAEPIIFVSGAGDPVVSDDAELRYDADQSYTDQRTARNDTQAELDAVADKFANPRMQNGVADMVERMTENMLDLPIGRFVAVMEQSVPGANRGRNRIRSTDTLADIAGRDADRLPDQLADGSRQMMGMMSGFAAAFATMIPEFKRLSRDMDKSFEDIEDIEEVGRNRD